jgi:hypothetical protein
VVNRVDAAPVDSDYKAAVNNSVQINSKFPDSTISVMWQTFYSSHHGKKRNKERRPRNDYINKIIYLLVFFHAVVV